MPEKLENPGSGKVLDSESLYLTRGGDVNSCRPLFTGDVFEDEGELTVILQHPCALRVNGVDLQEQLLVAGIDELDEPFNRGDWRGNYRLMPLPLLKDDAAAMYAGDFVRLRLVPRSIESTATRIACLSQVGVNLLLQRWVHHNSRVVVPTHLYQEVTSGPFEECDLTEEWADERAELLGSNAAAWAEAHEWFRAGSSDGRSRQSLLNDPQHRSSMRKEMRDNLKSMKASQ